MVADGVRLAMRRLVRLGNGPVGIDAKRGLTFAELPGRGSPRYQTSPEVIHGPPETSTQSPYFMTSVMVLIPLLGIWIPPWVAKSVS